MVRHAFRLPGRNPLPCAQPTTQAVYRQAEASGHGHESKPRSASLDGNNQEKAESAQARDS
jgi:hypothetical protein